MSAGTASDSEAVVLVHGLWMPGISMGLLSRRLRNCGYRCHDFSYHTLKHDLQTNADALYSFTQALHCEPVHFVCHSLGGLVVAQMFAQHSLSYAGRIVALGTPFQGSRVARRMADFSLGRRLLGASCRPLCDGFAHSHQGGSGLGIIAGNLKFGCGEFITRIRDDHDGTVAVAETHVDGVADELALRVSHTGLLSSAAVARQTCHFLKNGQFDRDIADRGQ